MNLICRIEEDKPTLEAMTQAPLYIRVKVPESLAIGVIEFMCSFFRHIETVQAYPATTTDDIANASDIHISAACAIYRWLRPLLSQLKRVDQIRELTPALDMASPSVRFCEERWCREFMVWDLDKITVVNYEDLLNQ